MPAENTITIIVAVAVNSTPLDVELDDDGDEQELEPEDREPAYGSAVANGESLLQIRDAVRVAQSDMTAVAYTLLVKIELPAPRPPMIETKVARIDAANTLKIEVIPIGGNGSGIATTEAAAPA